jgi:hypothetical protein
LIEQLEGKGGPRQQTALSRAIWVDVTREDLPGLFTLDN